MMTEEQLYAALQQMEKYGGGFASTIALAYYRADLSNKKKLLNAFGDLIELYIPSTKESCTK